MPRKKQSKSKRHYHILLILFLASSAVFFLHRESGREAFRPVVQPEEPAARPEKIPEIAIVIDDLGPNKKTAESILNINVPLTLSILPRETHSKWIADKGHRAGRDIIVHIPMESGDAHSLGKGGLYTWMTDDEIRNVLTEDLASVPHASGISNHMGSAFTKDERAMYVLIAGIRKARFFFLDSLTTPESVGYSTAVQLGVTALKRDTFLDYIDDPAAIRKQWNRTIDIAESRGYAIVLAHPRKNTIAFLRKTLPDSRIKIVPVSKLAFRD